jgi:hypothetical protein
VVVGTASWAVGIAGLVTALAGLLVFLVLTGATTGAVAAEVAGEDPSVQQSYRFGFVRLGSVLLVSVLVGLATVGGLILFVIPVSTSGCGWRSASRRWWWRAAGGTQAMGRFWELVGGHWWHAFGTLLVAWLIVGVVNLVITLPFSDTSWFVQGLVAAVATVVTLP